MLFLLSPAKTLDFERPDPPLPATEPAFVRQAQPLIRALRALRPAEVAALMDLSDDLARLNVARYAAWRARPAADATRCAVTAFAGDVYEGLDARSLKPDDLQWAQRHLRILSGLYGLLRPLDRIQPHRLEMGTPLAVGDARNLYGHWSARVTAAVNDLLRSDASPVVVNLASQEYAKVVDRRALKARVIDCQFEDFKPGGWTVVSFWAKRARGLMARHAIRERIDNPQDLCRFAAEGYAFAADVSTPERLVFRRRSPP